MCTYFTCNFYPCCSGSDCSMKDSRISWLCCSLRLMKNRGRREGSRNRSLIEQTFINHIENLLGISTYLTLLAERYALSRWQVV